MMWGLPTSVTVNGMEHEVNTDYRDILEIISYLQGDQDDDIKLRIALSLFFVDVDAIDDILEAYRQLCLFISCGEEDDKQYHPKLMDWEQDYTMIAAEINKVAHCEVRALPYLHWYTFIGYYSSIGEGQLSTIVAIRHKRAKGKKLEKWELEFYSENKNKVDFKVDYSEEEKARIAEIWGSLI